MRSEGIEPPTRTQQRQASLYQLSYDPKVHSTGLEPATSRGITPRARPIEPRVQEMQKPRLSDGLAQSSCEVPDHAPKGLTVNESS